MQTHEQTYFSARGQVVTALSVALVIVLNNQSMPLIKIVQYLGFYISVAFSWLFAWMIIHFIAWFSRSMDRFPRWNRSHDVRFFMQIIGGVVVPCLAAVALAFGFLEGFGQDFMASGYLKHEFPIICLLIVIMNLTYLVLHYRNEADRLADELRVKTVALRQAVMDGDQWTQMLQTLKETLDAATKDAAKQSEKLAKVEKSLAVANAELFLKSEKANLKRKMLMRKAYIEMPDAMTIRELALFEIRYIKYEKRRVWAITGNGRFTKRASLQKFCHDLPEYWFFRANNDVVINRKYIVNGPGIRKGRGMDVAIRTHAKRAETVGVRRNNVAAYLAWFSMPHE